MAAEPALPNQSSMRIRAGSGNICFLAYEVPHNAQKHHAVWVSGLGSRNQDMTIHEGDPLEQAAYLIADINAHPY